MKRSGPRLWMPSVVPERDCPRCHDAAGGMESLAGGACALGEVGWTLRSVVSYNVTKCDMRRSMCRSDVSVNGRAANDSVGIPIARTSLGATAPASDQKGRGAAFRRLAPRLCQRLHDRSCNEQRDDGDQLADENRAVQIERRPPHSLAVLYHPGPGGHRAHAKAHAAV